MEQLLVDFNDTGWFYLLCFVIVRCSDIQNCIGHIDGT